MESEPLPKGAPLPSPVDGHRWRQIAAVAAEIAAKWVHPPGSLQYETDTLHQVRAILYMNKTLITQSFVSHVSGVSQGSLSHYVRGLFRGNQKNIEDRLSSFVRKFASGELDTFLEEARSGSRPLRTVIYEGLAISSITPEKQMQSIQPPPQEFNPPVPPPPPPQLQPPPWSRPSPAKPPLPAVSTQQQPQQQQSVVQSGGSVEEVERDSAERARHARHSQMVALAKRRLRARTPFLTWLEDTKESTSVDAVEQAFHALVAPNWMGQFTHEEPLLLPILLYVEIGGRVLHMYTQWDVNERVLSPEVVAERIRRARGLTEEFAKPAAMQIRRVLFEAGVLCSPPPSAVANEERRLIRIEVAFESGEVLRDEFEWDLAMGLENSPELFAQYLCTDHGIAQKFAPMVARAIREKLSCAHAIAYGDEDTKSMALENLAKDDPLRKSLPLVVSALMKDAEHEQSRDLLEMEIEDLLVIPLLNAVEREATAREADRIKREEEEKIRRENEELRARREAEAAERKARIERALAEVDAAAVELQKQRGLDFRPYLALEMGYGERPGVWTPGVFQRKRRRQTSFPMLQPSKATKHLIQTGLIQPRLGRRRRSSARGDAIGEASAKMLERERREAARVGRAKNKRGTETNEHETRSEVRHVADRGRDGKVYVLLRIRPESKKRESSSRSAGGSARKRRRR